MVFRGATAWSFYHLERWNTRVGKTVAKICENLEVGLPPKESWSSWDSEITQDVALEQGRNGGNIPNLSSPHLHPLIFLFNRTQNEAKRAWEMQCEWGSLPRCKKIKEQKMKQDMWTNRMTSISCMLVLPS